MKFLLDANMPYSAKKVFGRRDKVLHVRDLGLTDAGDDKILERAGKEGAILITRDLDFANIILYPIDTHAGVIVLRLPPHFTAEHINKILKEFLSGSGKELTSYAVTIIEPGQYRMRR